MPQEAHIYQMFIAAPSDVKKEKEIIQELVSEWNELNGAFKNVRIEVKDWSDAFPFYGAHPQTIINKQVLEKSDFVVAVFWSRFGSPTEKHESGTEEEVEWAISNNVPLMLYFSDATLSPSKINSEEYQRIQNFKKKHQPKGLYSVFSEYESFRSMFRAHLAKGIEALINPPSSDNFQFDSEKDSTGEDRYLPHNDVAKLIKKNFKVYWAKLYGIIEQDENVLPNGFKISKLGKNKNEVKKMHSELNGWKERINKYCNDLKKAFDPINDYEADEFKHEVFAKDLWTVDGALSNPERELDRYRYSFEEMDASEIVETVNRIISTANEYGLNPPSKVKKNTIQGPQDLEYDILSQQQTLLTGVIGKGIRSEILHKLYPQYFSLMTRRSIWGLYYLTGESDEFVVDDTYQGKFRTVHNYDYLYDKFTYYNHIIFELMNEHLMLHKMKLDADLKYGFPNLFLVDIGKAHEADINKLKTPKKIEM